MARSGDPHLHAHLVIANRVTGPDGRWSAPDMRPVYADAKTAGTIADAVMRDELSRSLGVEWGPVANGIAELVAVPASVREHFSARHAEIMRGGDRARATSRSGHRRHPARDARPKAESSRAEEAVDDWRARAAEHGFGERELAAPSGACAASPAADYTERLRAQARPCSDPTGSPARAPPSRAAR